MMGESTKTIEIFYSYAHKDENLRNKLEKHLSNLKKQGTITSWYDREITPGAEWEREINTHINAASVILLLVSPDFIASDYCYGIEMKRAMERHVEGEAFVIPIMLRPTDIVGTPLDKLQALPINSKPVTDWRNQDQAFLNITQGIRKAIEKLSSEDNNEVVSHLLQQYCNTVYERYKMLDFKGIMHVERNRPMSIPLTEVFVFPEVLVGVPEYETIEREDIQESHTPEKPERRDEGVPSIPQKHLGRKRIVLLREELHTVLARNQRLVILGDPGSGKSTLLLYLMLQLTLGREKFNIAFPQLEDASYTIPLYIPLARYAEVWLTNPLGERSLKYFLPKYLNDNYLDPYSHFLQRQLEQGRVFLLLDGLDEITDATLRIQIVRQIEAFTQVYPENRFIVTSRIVGYKEAQLAAGYQPYTLADFNEKQVKTFTQKWCSAYEHWIKGTEESQYLRIVATNEAGKLFQAINRNPGVKRLAVNPLLLTILALIQRQGIELPGHRIELFELCATTLLDTWVKAKGYFVNFSKSDLIKILRPLAFWMHEYAAVGVIPEEEMTEQIVNQLLERRIARYEDDAMKLAKQFLDTVRGTLGILVERGKYRYGFLHLTFEEYFAAKELEKRKDRKDFIKKYLHDSRWREVILLTVSDIGILQSKEEEVTELVQDAILKAESPFENWLHRDLLFAGLCLADDVGVTVACENEIVEQIVNLYSTTPYFALSSAILNMMTHVSETRLATKIINLVLPLLRNRAAAIEATSSAFSSSLLKTSEKKLPFNHHHLIQDHKEAKQKLLHLHIIIILGRLQMDITAWIDDIIEMLTTDRDWRLREATALALGQLRQVSPQVIEALRKVLNDPDNDVRWAAACTLIQLADKHPQAIDALLTALNDPNIGWMVARELGHLGRGQPPVVDALLRSLVDNSQVRWTAARALGYLGQRQPEIVDALLKALNDHSPQVREEALNALTRVGTGQPSVINALLKVLRDSDARVRWTAANVLGQLGNEQPHIINRLLHALAFPDFNVKETGANVLRQLIGGSLHVINALLNALVNPNFEVKWAAVRALRYLGPRQPQVVAALLRSLGDPDFQVRWAAALSLGQTDSESSRVIDALLDIIAAPAISWAVSLELGELSRGQPRVIDALLRILANDSDFRVRAMASRALGQLGKDLPQVVDALLHQVLTEDSRFVVRAAVHAVGQLSQGQSQVVNALLEILADPVRRGIVVEELGWLSQKHPQVIDNLFQTLTNPDPAIKEAAIYALGQSNQRHPEVINTLINALSDRDPNVKVAVIDVLGRVGREHSEVVDALLGLHPLPNSKEGWVLDRALRQLTQKQPQGIGALFKALNDQNPNVQKASIYALAQLGQGQPEVIDALLQMLYNDNSYVREAAVNALSQLGQDQPRMIDVLLEFLANDKANVRQCAAHLLGLLGSGQPQVIDVLLQDLSSPDFKIRKSAISALVGIGSKHPHVVRYLLDLLSNAPSDDLWREIIDEYEHSISKELVVRHLILLKQIGRGQSELFDVIVKLLSDPDAEVRGAAADTLKHLGQGQPQVINTLLQLLKAETDIDIKRVVASVLAQLGQEQPQVLIDALLRSLTEYNSAIAEVSVDMREHRGQLQLIDALLQVLPDPAIGIIVVRALGQIEQEQPQLIDALLSLFSSPDSDIKRVVVRALGQLAQKYPKVIVTLLEALSDRNFGVKVAAIEALGQLAQGHLEAVDALLKTLSSCNPEVKVAAIKALGQLAQGHPEAVDTLLKTLSSRNPEVKVAAIEALGQLAQGHPEAIDTLLKTLSSRNPEVKVAAIEALGQLAQGHPEAIDALLKTLSSRNPGVRRKTVLALGHLNGRHQKVITALREALLDSDFGVREAAANTLGQLGQGQSQVIDSLLHALSDRSSDVIKAAASALATLRIDRKAVGDYIEELLRKHEPTDGNQFATNDTVDALLFALQEVVGSV